MSSAHDSHLESGLYDSGSLPDDEFSVSSSLLPSSQLAPNPKSLSDQHVLQRWASRVLLLGCSLAIVAFVAAAAATVSSLCASFSPANIVSKYETGLADGDARAKGAALVIHSQPHWVATTKCWTVGGRVDSASNARGLVLTNCTNGSHQQTFRLRNFHTVVWPNRSNDLCLDATDNVVSMKTCIHSASQTWTHMASQTWQFPRVGISGRICQCRCTSQEDCPMSCANASCISFVDNKFELKPQHKEIDNQFWWLN